MIFPQASWFWLFEGEYLALTLAPETSFKTAFTKTKLQAIKDNQAFSSSDCEAYTNVVDSISGSDFLTQAHVVQIAVNACAAMQYAKPVPAKAWLFEVLEQQPSFEVGIRLAKVVTQFAEALVLTLSEHRGFVSCLLLSNELQIAELKYLKAFQLLLLPRDRLAILD